MQKEAGEPGLPEGEDGEHLVNALSPGAADSAGTGATGTGAIPWRCVGPDPVSHSYPRET